MIEKIPESTDTSDREIVIRRVMDAPRELIFQVWTSADHLAHWWGPLGFTITTYQMDFRTGGVWRYVMHGPDGRDYQNKIVYLEIAPPERLVYAHRGDEAECEPVNFHTTVTFEDQAGKTLLTMRALFNTAEDRDHVIREYGAEEGGHQTLARLAEYLTTNPVSIQSSN